MTYIVQTISDDQVGSIESQVHQAPRVGAESPKSPEEFGRLIKAETARFGKAVKDSGAKAD